MTTVGSHNSLGQLYQQLEELLAQLIIARYCLVASGVALLWDGLNNIHEDVELFSKFRFSFTDATYIFARITTSVSLCLNVLFTVILDGDCTSLGQAASWLSTVGFISTSLLLQLRVRAVFRNSMIIQAILILLWVVVIVGSFALNFSHRFSRVELLSIGCIVIPNKPFGILILALALGYDTLVSLALSHRLLMNSAEETWPGRLRMFVSKSGMPHISRLLLQTEQLSYAVTITLNIVAIVIVFAPFIPGIYRIIFLIISLAIRNILVCHIYRRTKLKATIHGTTTSSSLAASRSASLRFASNPLGRRSQAVLSSSGTENPWVLPPVEGESRS